MTARRPRLAIACVAAIALTAPLAVSPLPVAAAQATPGTALQPAPPAFGAQAAAITVDVVVVDGKGQPVRGLTKDDFTVLEDGRRQTVVGFRALETAPSATAAEAAVPATPTIGAANDEHAPRPERV